MRGTKNKEQPLQMVGAGCFGVQGDNGRSPAHQEIQLNENCRPAVGKRLNRRDICTHIDMPPRIQGAKGTQDESAMGLAIEQ